jgi:hypothetical protein
MKSTRIVAGGMIAALLILGAAWKMASAQRMATQPEPAKAELTTGTAITFQGQLTFDGQPLNDDCWMRFMLYDEAAAGSQVGSTITTAGAIPVQDGLFTVELDFGDVFDGTALWLDIAVQCSADSSYVSIGRQKLTAVPYAVHSDLLDGSSGDFYRNASNLNAGTLAPDRFSAFGDLGTEGYLGNASGDLAQNNGTLQTNLDADLLDGVQGSLYERATMEGTVEAGSTQIIDIPSWYPFTLQLASGWPDWGGMAMVMGFENDRFIGVTYILYNGDGTSEYGGSECWEGSDTVLVEFGNGDYTYQLKCPGEASGAHNLLLVVPYTAVEMRYKLIY